MRRVVVAVMVMGLVLGLGAAPALAVIQSNESVIGAEADWSWSEGDAATSVHLRIADNRLKPIDAASERSAGLNVQIYRTWTDAATGAAVTEFLMTDPFYAPASTLAMHQLRDASVMATVTLTGMRWTGDEETLVGPYEIVVVADWAVSGSITREREHTWSTEAGSWTDQRVALRSAPATASASITGDLELGNLGSVDGQLVVLRDRAMAFETAGVPALAATTLLGLSQRAPTTSHILRAVAGWTLDDAYGSELWLTVEQASDRSEGSAPAMAFAELNQGYCDPATGESVMRMLSTEPTPLTSGGVSQSMNGATATASLTFTGVEIRQPGCDMSGEGDETWNEVTFSVSIDATWTATGDLEFYRVQRTVRSDDQFMRARSDARGRQASASGSVIGSVVSGPLVTVVNAYLEDRHDWSMGGEPGS